jgi:hypothetical protein
MEHHAITIQPKICTFNNTYHLLQLPTLTSKTRETAFQILNRTDWTNNRAFQSYVRPDPNYGRCSWGETMEHLLCICEYYSELLWNRLGDVLTWHFNSGAEDLVPTMELEQTNIIFNIPHLSILHHIHDRPTRNTLCLIQIIKIDIIYRRMNLPPSVQQVTAIQRLAAHLDSTI